MSMAYLLSQFSYILPIIIHEKVSIYVFNIVIIYMNATGWHFLNLTTI